MKGWYNNTYPTYHINNILCNVSPNITVLFTRLNKGFNVVDSGADTHVVSIFWKPLYPVTSNNPRADVIGFNNNIT